MAFKISHRPADPVAPMAAPPVWARTGALGAALAVLLWGGVARAQTTYFTPRSVLADFFPKSQRVTFRTFEITPDRAARLASRLGSPPRASYTIYVAMSGEAVDGYAILDEEKGEHLPISYAVKFSPEGTVLRQEIMIYRERYGDEVRDERFRRQFVGKTAASPLRPGDDIAAVSGATISSRAMAAGVRRDLVLLDELLLRPERVRGAGAASAPSGGRVDGRPGPG